MHRNVRIAAACAIAVVVTACANGETVETTSPTVTGDNTTSETTTTTTTLPETTTTTTAATTTTEAPPETEPEFAAIEVVYAGGSVAGESRRTVALGEDVAITVESDVTDEVHLHGYDLFADVAPGAPATIEFTADIPGIFELELEGSHDLLIELEVTP